MGRLHKLECWAFVWFLLSGCIAFGQTYCSLTVRVLAPDGRRPEVSISVAEKNGRTLEKDQEPDLGDVDFCDLGGLPVDVKVGNDGSCNQVTVHDVPIVWKEPYLLRVTYDPEPCLRESPLPLAPVCRIVFRVSSTADKWLRDATIALSQPTAMQLRTDQFGRASVTAKIGQEVAGTVSFGSEVHSFTLKCAQFEITHEEFLKLIPSGAAAHP